MLSKKILKTTALLLLFLIAGYNFLLSDFNPMFKDAEFVYLYDKLKMARRENLESFTSIYNTAHKRTKRETCPCERSSNYIGPYRHGLSLTKRIYQLKIEREFTHDDCLKFQLLNADYLFENTGIKEASKFYFHKTVEQLNEEEKIILVVMLENPNLYNPVRRKEKVMDKARIYQRILHEND